MKVRVFVVVDTSGFLIFEDKGTLTAGDLGTRIRSLAANRSSRPPQVSLQKPWARQRLGFLRLGLCQVVSSGIALPLG